MLPTINGEVVLVDNFSFNILKKKPKKGDIVIGYSPNSQWKLVCKRVGGIEGDILERNINGIYFPEKVPEGHVWLLGDNPDMSLDSRTYGPVPLSNIKGRVFFKVNNLEEIK